MQIATAATLVSLCDHCHGPREVVTGHGTVPYYNSPECGGTYFCSYECREAFVQKEQSAVDPATAHLLDLLAQARCTDGESLQDIAQKLAAYLPPTVEVLEHTAERFVVKITVKAEIHGLSCLMCGDENLAVHTGPDGIAHTPMRVGDFAHAISMCNPRAILRSIAGIKFTRMVAIGEPVTITVTSGQSRGKLHTYDVVGHCAGQPICHPAVVTVVAT